MLYRSEKSEEQITLNLVQAKKGLSTIGRNLFGNTVEIDESTKREMKKMDNASTKLGIVLARVLTIL